MPNAFQSLGDETYGPQYQHNVAVIALAAEAASTVAELLETRKMDRSIGVVGSVLRPAPEMLGDIPVFPLEDLDPCDFDIVLVVDACLDEADLPSKSDWTKEKFLLVQVQAAEKINEQVDELLRKIDDAQVRRACGAGTSC
ncbi:unnamed protein product [Durusdinium trenchii]|uniref:Protein-tyrosine-phosphatase n=2 Tax=Durusdinium trenchii TaxID=1381693 RepID=A0ABP0NIZ1_9DINO